MIRKYYIASDATAAQQDEAFFYSTFVTSDGVNFKPPFMPGTDEYLILVPHPVDARVAIYVTDRMTELADQDPQVAQMINPQYDETELNQLGWDFMIDPGA